MSNKEMWNDHILILSFFKLLSFNTTSYVLRQTNKFFFNPRLFLLIEYYARIDQTESRKQKSIGSLKKCICTCKSNFKNESSIPRQIVILFLKSESHNFAPFDLSSDLSKIKTEHAHTVQSRGPNQKKI